MVLTCILVLCVFVCMCFSVHGHTVLHVLAAECTVWVHTCGWQILHLKPKSLHAH